MLLTIRPNKIKRLIISHITILSVLLFIYSGYVKVFIVAYPQIFPSTIDITAFSLVLALFFSIITNDSRISIRKTPLPLVIFTVLLILIIISLYYSHSKVYAILKTRNIFTNIFALALPMLTPTILSSKLFFKYLIFFGSVLGLLYVTTIKPFIWAIDHFYPLRTNYLTCGLFSSISILVLYYKKKVFKNLILISLLTFVNLIVLVISGARAPLIFLLLMISTIFVFKSHPVIVTVINRKKFRYIFLLLILTVFLFFIAIKNNRFGPDIEKHIGYSIERLSLLTQADKGGSINERTNYSSFVFNNFTNSILIGHGVGSFPVLYEGKDQRGYPHNVFLELLFEYGIIGVFIFIAFLFSCFRHRNGDKTILIISVFIFLNTLKSYGFEDLRFFVFFIGLYYMSSRINLKNGM